MTNNSQGVTWTAFAILVTVSLTVKYPTFFGDFLLTTLLLLIFTLSAVEQYLPTLITLVTMMVNMMKRG